MKLSLISKPQHEAAAGTTAAVHGHEAWSALTNGRQEGQLSAF